MSLIDKTSSLGLAKEEHYTNSGTRTLSKLVDDKITTEVKPLTGTLDPTDDDLFYNDGTSMVSEYIKNLPEGQTR